MQSTKKKIVVVGSINIDLVAYTSRIPVEGETITGNDFKVHPGGKGANQAVAVARLGWPVQMIGRVGDDAFGQQMRQNLQDAGVDVSGVLISPGSSGVAMILVSDSGENCIVITPGANALVTAADLDANLPALEAAGMVLAQLEIPLETIQRLATICARSGVPLMLDPAPARKLPDGLLEKVAWFSPNETEAAFYIDSGASAAVEPLQVAKELLKQGCGGVVLKLGARGAYIKGNGSGGASVSPFRVEAVDTTAAGDAFNGAFATALLMGQNPGEGARFAAAAAALSTTRLGAQPSMPTLLEVERLLKLEPPL